MQKFTLLTISLFCIAFISQAQISKGSVLLGGGISGGSSESEEGTHKVSNSSFSISPTVGWAVRENSVFGLRLSYSKRRIEELVPDRTHTFQDYGAGIFFRQYKPLGKNFFLFGESALNYLNHRYKQSEVNPVYSNTRTTHGVALNLHPGIAYAASTRFHLEIGLNDLVSLHYQSGTSETTSFGTRTMGKTSGFNFSTSLNTTAPLTVGFRFVLARAAQ